MNGSDLRAWRRANGLRQVDLASRLGVTQGAVSRWEAGIDEPSLTLAKRLENLIRGYDSREIVRQRFFLEHSPAVGILLDLDGMRLIATSAAHRKFWPEFQSYLGKPLIEELVGTTKALVFDEKLYWEAVEGELVQVRGVALEHTRLDPGTGISHEWQANIRKIGAKTLIEVTYNFELKYSDEGIFITRMADIRA